MEQYGMTAEEYRGYTIEGTLKTLGEIDEATSKTMLILALPSIAKNAVKTAKDVAENGVHFDTSIALKAGGEAAEEGAKDTAENIAKKEIKETMTNGVFSNVNEAELKDRVRTHVFSQKHIKAGVLDLGNSQDNILDKGFDVVKTLDEKGLIKDGSTQIKTHIDGMEAEIRVFIKDGKIINLDMFKGHSGRDMGNTIYF